MTREAKKSNDTSSSSSSKRGETSEKRRKRSGNGKAAKNDVVDTPIDSDDKSAYVKVTEAVRTFNKHYLHFVQVNFSPTLCFLMDLITLICV